MKRTPMPARKEPPLTRKPMPRASKPMPKVSAKRRAYRQSAEGRAGMRHMAKVKGLHCVTCGAPPPNDAHHCRDRPDLDEQGLYYRMPGAGQKADDRDTIALCRPCHDLFHLHRAEFHRLYGRDYGYLWIVRAAFAPADEISF